MLKARDVWDEQEARKEQRMSAMRPVLAQLYGRIRKQAIHSPNAPYVVFEIPAYVFGYPLFVRSTRVFGCYSSNFRLFGLGCR